jgi:hypothetical protein
MKAGLVNRPLNVTHLLTAFAATRTSPILRAVRPYQIRESQTQTIAINCQMHYSAYRRIAERDCILSWTCVSAAHPISLSSRVGRCDETQHKQQTIDLVEPMLPRYAPHEPFSLRRIHAVSPTATVATPTVRPVCADSRAASKMAISFTPSAKFGFT